MADSARTKALLLPGIHGSARLFAPLLAAEPRIGLDVLSYPPAEPLGLDELSGLVRERLPSGRFLLVAESFSGPIAVKVAATRPPGLAGLVLAATYLRAPLPSLLRPAAALVVPAVLSHPLPAPFVRLFLAGADAPDALVEEIRAATAEVAPEVMARRIADALAVDAREDLARVNVPILFLAPSRDRLVRTDAVDDVLAVKPGAEVVTLDSPHVILQRCPQASLARIEEFARRAGDGG